MPHDMALVATITAGLVLAFVGGLAANRLRLPPLIGYLLAGVAIGPFTPGFVADIGLAMQLADIGIVLLMFGVGLHFSIKDLLAVRKIALPGALVQMTAATALGLGIAWSWGWPMGAGLIFGLSLSVASTVVLLRALERRNLVDSDNGQIAVGWLIVEDLATVLALVLLPALAGLLGGDTGTSETLASGEIALALLLTVAKVGVFLVLVIVVGTRFIPWMLAHVARTGSRELFTLAVLAVALGIAFGSATLFGVSVALGAFFAGVVLSESDFSYQAAADALPLRDAFAVLFFVSVGMLFDPAILVREPVAVLSVVLVIVLGKSVAASAIVLLLGYPMATALMVSASLAQIGEFSFVLAGLGVALKLLPATASDLIMAGALISITLNPLVFAAFARLSVWLHTRPALLRRLERANIHPPTAPAGESPVNHAIIVGFGRVGSLVGKGLVDKGIRIVVIDQDHRRVEKLRSRGIRAVYGDATTLGVLEAAGARQARLVVIATPDGFHTRRILEIALALNPSIDTAVRTQSNAEVAHLEQLGVGVAIMGERELALGLLGYALASLGVDREEIPPLLQAWRVSGDGGVYERREAPDDGSSFS